MRMLTDRQQWCRTCTKQPALFLGNEEDAVRTPGQTPYQHAGKNRTVEAGGWISSGSDTHPGQQGHHTESSSQVLIAEKVSGSRPVIGIWGHEQRRRWNTLGTYHHLQRGVSLCEGFQINETERKNLNRGECYQGPVTGRNRGLPPE